MPQLNEETSEVGVDRLDPVDPANTAAGSGDLNKTRQHKFGGLLANVEMTDAEHRQLVFHLAAIRARKTIEFHLS